MLFSYYCGIINGQMQYAINRKLNCYPGEKYAGGNCMPIYILPCICVGVFITLIIIQVIMHSEHPVRAAVLSLLPGPAAMLCINLLSAYTSVSVPVSPLSLAVSAVLGIPGLTMLLIVCRIL